MVEISKERIIKGKDAFRILPVIGYEDMQVRIRSLTDLELAEVIGIAKQNGWIEFFNIVSGGENKIAQDISLISGAIPLMVEICSRGTIIYKGEEGEENRKELTKEEKKDIFKDIGRFATVSIGVEILMDTLKPLEDLEGFMVPPKQLS